MTSLPRDAEFYLSHSGYVRALARQVVFDAHSAEDIAQETWLAALEHPPRDARSPRGWLKSLVRGLASKAWLSRERREQREQTRFDAQGSPPTPDELVEHESARRRIFDALLALDEPYRSALWLRYYDELPPREIAARLGLPVETVRTHLKRGLERLRVRLRRDTGAVWSVVLVRALRLEPLSYRAAARAAIRTLLQGMVVVSVAQKVLVASAAIAVVAGSLWFFGHSRAIAPQAASVAPAPTELAAVAVETDGASAATPAARNAVEVEPASAPSSPPANAHASSLLLHLVWGDDKTPAKHIGLRLYQSAASDYYQDSLLLETGDDGSVVVDPVLAGHASVLFDRGGAGEVSIEAGQRTEATLELPVGFDIEGHVRDAAGRAVAGAEIYLYGMIGATYDGYVVARSGDDGSYFVRSVKSGMCYVSARASWHAPTKQHLVMSVARTKVTADLVFEIAGGSVEGRVLAPDGTPCPRAAVVVGLENEFRFIRLDDGSDGLKPSSQRVFTDGQGRFQLAGVAEGTHPIQARAKGLAPWKGEVVVFANHTTPLDVSLVLGARLEGTVRDASGAPIARAEVNVAGGAGFASAHRKTGEDGSFAIDGLPLGEFDVGAVSEAKGAAETKLIGVSGATLRWDAVLSRGHVLRGRVEAPGEELAKWWIELETNDTSTHFGPATTDATGHFEFVDCPDVSMRLSLHRPKGALWPAAVLDDVRATGDELVVRPDPALDPTVHIRGRIVAPDGQPIGGAQIIPGLTGFHSSPIAMSKAQSGAFELGPYPRGEWMLMIKAAGFADVHVERRTLASGETWELGDLVMQHGGQVIVHVRRAPGVDEPRPQITLVAANGQDEWLALDGDVARSRPLEPGRYRLICGGKGIALAAQDVEVVADAETHAEVLLRAGSAVRVRIVDASERALDVRVDYSITDDGGRTLQDGSLQPRDGPIEWSGTLAPGKYRFTARATTGAERSLDFEVVANAAPAELTLRIP